ncbi:MAG: PHP domain-containing protein [Candidatus Nealsonbacteria bacterium]|nr:PHP domain-containing protein [Candidatus Nealsonbacteria bacterium]
MKIDFHIHTNFSCDALNSPEEVVLSAISKGFDCICIVDHGTTEGASKALSFASKKPILVIPCIEINSKEGDIIGFNIKENIANGFTARDTIKKINLLGGIAIIAHPFAWPKNFKGNLEKFVIENKDLFFAVEVLNASAQDWANKKALGLVKKFNLPFTAGSDAHEASFIGKAFLEISKDCFSAGEILEEIKKRNALPRGEKVSFLLRMKNLFSTNIRKLKKGKTRA